MSRQKIVNRRPCVTSDLIVNGKPHQVTIGFYPETGDLAEVFIHGSKSGTDTEHMLYDIGVSMSLLLQHGATPSSIADSLCKDERGKPASVAGAVMRAVVKEAREIARG